MKTHRIEEKVSEIAASFGRRELERLTSEEKGAIKEQSEAFFLLKEVLEENPFVVLDASL